MRMSPSWTPSGTTRSRVAMNSEYQVNPPGWSPRLPITGIMALQSISFQAIWIACSAAPSSFVQGDPPGPGTLGALGLLHMGIVRSAPPP